MVLFLMYAQILRGPTLRRARQGARQGKTFGAALIAALVAAWAFLHRDYYTLGNSAITNFQVCVNPNVGAEPTTVAYWDREENTPSAPPTQFVISPGTPVAVSGKVESVRRVGLNGPAGLFNRAC